MSREDDFAIAGATVIDGTGRPAAAQSGILVRAGSIEEIGPAKHIAESADRAGLTLIDATGASLVPGLIDAHVHIAWGDERIPTWGLVEANREFIDAYAISSVQAAVRVGITTVRDCGAPGAVTMRTRDAVNAGLFSGPTILAAGPCITTTGGHGDFIGVAADTGDELVRRVRELASAGVDHVKIMVTGGDMDPNTNRRAAQYTREELIRAVSDAHRLGLHVVAHCNATEGIRRAVAAGVDTIAHCNWLGEEAGTIDYDPVTADELISAGTWIDLNLEATFRNYSDGDGAAQEWIQPDPPRNRWELHKELRAAGARILFSSDEFGPRIALFPSLLARAAKELALTIEEVVQRATSVPASALGLSAQVGQLTPGLVADLLLLDGDLCGDPYVLTRPTAVWQSGRQLLERPLIGPSQSVM